MSPIYWLIYDLYFPSLCLNLLVFKMGHIALSAAFTNMQNN